MVVKFIKDTFCTRLSNLFTKSDQLLEDQRISNIFYEVNPRQRFPSSSQRPLLSPKVVSRALTFRRKSPLEERLTTEFSENFKSGLDFLTKLEERLKNEIKIVDLSQGLGTKVNSRDLIEIIKRCPNIKALNVSNNKIIKGDFLKHLPANLKCLQLDDTDCQKINKTSLITAFERFTQLEFLSLVRVSYPKDLLLSLPKSLKALSFSYWEALRKECFISIFLHKVFLRLNKLEVVESFNIVQDFFEDEKNTFPRAQVHILPESIASSYIQEIFNQIR